MKPERIDGVSQAQLDRCWETVMSSVGSLSTDQLRALSYKTQKHVYRRFLESGRAGLGLKQQNVTAAGLNPVGWSFGYVRGDSLAGIPLRPEYPPVQIATENGFGVHDTSCRCPACVQAATAPTQASLPLPTSDRSTGSPKPASEALANAMRRGSLETKIPNSREFHPK